MRRTIPLFGRGRTEEPEWPVLLTVAVALLFGALVAILATSGTTTARSGDPTASYANGGDMVIAFPDTWVQSASPGAAIAAVDYDRGGIFGARVSVRRLPKEELAASSEVVVGDAAAAWVLRQSEALTAYRILDLAPTTVRGRDAVRIEYAYLDEGPGGATSGALPGLMRGADTIVDAGDSYAILTLASETGEWRGLTRRRFPRLRSIQDQIVASWRF